MLSLGIDIGSTTVKFCLTDNNQVLYKSYRRHLASPTTIIIEEINKIKPLVKGKIKLAITGSGGLDLANKIDVTFVQEVFATANFVPTLKEKVDVVIELGGEDAKIIFFDQSIDEKMNGTCAGGTGAFIDQMASLLNVSVSEMDELSLKADAIYPIASRCGVFAKSDIQPLINQGASKANIAASVYQAVVDQTIGGLAGGRVISGNVLYLGGPLTFCKGLQERFVKSLKYAKPIFIEDSEYFVCLATSYYASLMDKTFDLDEVLTKIIDLNKHHELEDNSNDVLFKDEEEYAKFVKRHNVDVKYDYGLKNTTKIYLGLDAGSTTTKLVATNENKEIVFSTYKSNKGNPLDTVKEELIELYDHIGNIPVVSSVVTGYGEDLIREAYGFSYGVVETVAHFTASRYFMPNVDTIIDIGGQDMKCFKIKNHAIDQVILNEACSSGCGSFLETFAKSMGYSIEEFSHMALFAKNPVNLGSRCTVFMNSSVKQAQKQGATPSDIAAGLSISVVKNALYKVLRVSSKEELGQNIIVQGGTFKNDAVLRAFEKHLGCDVLRLNIAGLMGAYGASLIAMTKENGEKFISREDLENFKYDSKFTRCNLCPNKCSLTINTFSLNNKRYISGNRCNRPLGISKKEELPNVYRFKQDYFNSLEEKLDENKKTIGIPLVLSFYDNLPFFYTLIKELGFNVKISGKSNRAIYRKGQHTITSDTICYGAKLVNGHIIRLLEEKVDAIFYPKMSYNFNEHSSDNYFNCPVVAYYPEVIKANIEMGEVSFLDDYLDINNDHKLCSQILEEFKRIDPKITRHKVKEAIEKAHIALDDYRKSVKDYAKDAISFAKANNKKIIVLCGRPYHVDPEINHGIDTLISNLGVVVLSEDSLEYSKDNPEISVLNQWTYHNRMYQAANTVLKMDNTELVQLVSFGCGLDAVTTDEVSNILTKGGKLYTSIKIDEINNLGAAKIRIRSLLAFMEEKYGN